MIRTLAAVFLCCPLLAQQSTAPAAPAQIGAAGQNAPAGAPPDGGGFSADVPVQATSHAPIRITTRLVTVDVVVTDKSGNPVRGLKKDDFRLLEDGKPQSISVFDEETGGGLVVPVPTLTAGHATNAGQTSSTPALNVILFDALNTVPSDQAFARQQTIKLMQSLPAGSRVAIFVLGNSLHMLQGFTTDSATLLRAVSGERTEVGPYFNDPEMVFLSGSQGNAGTSISESMQGDAVAGSTTGTGSFASQNAARDEAALTSDLRIRKTIEALGQLAFYLGSLPGRKNLMWVSGTFPTDLLPDLNRNPGDMFRDTATYTGTMARISLQLEQNDIAVYPVEATGIAGDPLFGGANSKRPGVLDLASSAGVRSAQHNLMEDVAYETGGRALYNTNDLRAAMTEVLNTDTAYYTLAYSPTNQNWNGRERKITVQMPGKTYRIEYRHEYLAADQATLDKELHRPDAFQVAMLHGAPERDDVTLTVNAEPTGKLVHDAERERPSLNHPIQKLRGTTEKYKIVAVVDAKQLKFPPVADNKRKMKIAVTFLVFDADGKVLNSAVSGLDLPLPEKQLAAIEKDGLTLSNELELPPGRVFVRVGVRDMNSGRVGSVELPVVVNLPKA